MRDGGRRRATCPVRLQLMFALVLCALVPTALMPAGCVPAGCVPTGCVPAGCVPAGCVPAAFAPSRASAQQPTVVALGVAAESATSTVAPTVLVRVPLDAQTLASASQIGWTSQLALERAIAPHLALLAFVSGSPIHAFLGNVAFEAGHRTGAAAFDAATVRADAGVVFDDQDHLRAQLALSAQRNFVDGLDAQTERRWNALYVGSELRMSAQWLRSDEPLRARADGLLLQGSVRALSGPQPWLSLQAEARAGRRAGRVFCGGSVYAFALDGADRVNAIPIGGSWDALGAQVLYGFPLAAYRLARGASAVARVDVRVVGTLELGLRGSVLARQNAAAYGGALQLTIVVAGVDLTAGIGLGRPERFAPNAYASAQGVWLL